MNRIFGFFKQKIIEVKQQNKQELQALANALSEQQYSSERVLSQLQSMKSNFMNWNILIANEASTGLYYSQIHNRNICLRKIKGNKQLKKQCQKNSMKLQFVKNTATELADIGKLTGNWMNQVNKEVEGIQRYLEYQQQIVNKKIQLRSRIKDAVDDIKVNLQIEVGQSNEKVLECGDKEKDNAGNEKQTKQKDTAENKAEVYEQIVDQ